MPSKLPPHRRGLESLSAGRRRHVVIDQSSTPPNQTRTLARTLAIQVRKIKTVDGKVKMGGSLLMRRLRINSTHQRALPQRPPGVSNWNAAAFPKRLQLL